MSLYYEARKRYPVEQWVIDYRRANPEATWQDVVAARKEVIDAEMDRLRTRIKADAS